MASPERNHNSDHHDLRSSDPISEVILPRNTARFEETTENITTAAAAQARSEADALKETAERRYTADAATTPAAARTHLSETESGAASVQEQPIIKRRTRTTGDGALWRLSKSGRPQQQEVEGVFDSPSDGSSSPSASGARILVMSSQRSRQPRNGGRGDSNDDQLHKEMWDEVKRLVSALKTGEITAAQHHEKIFAHEEKLNAKKNTPEGLSIPDIDEHSGLFREGVKMAENQKVRISEELRTRIELLRDTMKIKEKEQEKLNDEGSVTGRASSSRTSAMDFDGPNDSPVPSPADNRQARKLGGPSRTSSQPPRGAGDKDNTPSEASERASKPKIVYHQGQEVAFKRKIPGRNDEQDWIQGKVVRVIGEGKSRRYDVKDPFPEENSGPNVYKSSASQMVPIPPEGAKLGDFEVGRTVLALYPGTTTFYRAEVKAMLEGGKKVQLLFEGETDAQLSSQDRRFVLDHKG